MTESTSEGLTLPDPQQMAIAAVRAELIPMANAWRERCRDAKDIGGARDLTRRLEAFRTYMQDREGRDLIAAECRRTEVLIGQLLGPGEPGNPHSLTSLASEVNDVPRGDRHKFRLLAEHEDYVEEWLGDGVTSRAKILSKIERLRDNEDLAGAVDAAAPEVLAGDFRDVLADIPDGSVTLVLTDPPYGNDAIPSYGQLGEFAARVLRPGGSLVCYTGQSILPDVMDELREHLRYWWTFAVTHEHGGQQLPGKWVMVEWKPIVWFVKDHRLGMDYIGDRLRGSAPEKAHHEWAQGIEEVVPILEKLTEPGELVVDPFAGSGAFGRAALGLGRRFVGADLDPQSGHGRVA